MSGHTPWREIRHKNHPWWRPDLRIRRWVRINKLKRQVKAELEHES